MEAEEMAPADPPHVEEEHPSLSPALTSSAYDFLPSDMQDDMDQDSRSDEEEVDVDLCGRKHVDKRADESYTVSGASLSIYRRHSTKVQGSAQAMRNWLKVMVSEHFLRDEYGNQKPVEEILSSRLPKLQASMWREWPRVAAELGLLSHDTYDAAEHETIAAHAVVSVGKFLQANHVFVLRPRSISTCSLRSCPQIERGLSSPREPYEIALEPLVDWMTLDTVDDVDLFRRQILLFRRNNYLQLEFKIDHRKLIPKKPITLCVECLQYLWDRRMESYYFMHTFTGMGAFEYLSCWIEPVHAYDEGNDADDGTSGRDDKGDESDLGPYAKDPAQTYAVNTVDVNLSTNLQVDGTSESESCLDSSFKVLKDQEANSETDDREVTMSASSPLHGVKSPTLPRSTFTIYDSSLQYPSLSGWAAINMRNPTTLSTVVPSANDTGDLLSQLHKETDPTAGLPFAGTFTKSELEKYPNAHAGFPHGRPEGRELKPDVVYRVPSMIDYGPLQADPLPRRTSPSQVELDEADTLTWKRKVLGEVQSNSFARAKSSPRGLRITTPISAPTTTERDRQLSPQPSPATQYHMQSPTLKRSKVLPRLTSPKFPLNPRLGPSMPTAPMRPKKRNEPPPIVVVSLAWPTEKPPPTPRLGSGGAPIKHVPAANDRICTCREPAQTNFVKIVECYNPNCKIQWYHYGCLDKTNKLSSNNRREPTWICEQCRAEVKLVEMFGKNNMVEDWGRVTDIRSPWSAKELSSAAYYGFGGPCKQDPYGLDALVTQYSEVGRVTNDVKAPIDTNSLVCQAEATQRTATPTTAPTVQHCQRTSDSRITCRVDAGAFNEKDDINEETGQVEPQPQPTLSTLGTLPSINLVASQPYWLSRAYSKDRMQFAEEFVSQDMSRRPRPVQYEDDYLAWSGSEQARSSAEPDEDVDMLSE
ncbi:hypothetical protein CC80DRAFT_114515 [Byssothecium circinans]|uniref:PHD-type domain-containing protein n=1 Tax=Byssothecium circinans TaxID=147558 RepID=A0A6A5TQN2_9PLEO|nr:hypothetical protein CC80DRAFT_114515 [Byssothecium circinans]